ncbi:hypothetical protein KFE98_04245 [bacterium SCSIO 12741]|nr:hypothetical protein KFE98_04245 [bacterium SCSIO 12741]
MKTNILTLIALILLFVSGCKKQDFRDADMQVRHCAYPPQDTTAIDFSRLHQMNDDGSTKIVKIDNQTLLDSVIPLSGGILDHVNLDEEVVFLMTAYPRSETGECPELRGYKVKVNSTDEEIDFTIKIKGYDGKSSSRKPFMAFLIVPRSEAHYSISGRMTITKFKFFNMTGSSRDEYVDYEL